MSCATVSASGHPSGVLIRGVMGVASTSDMCIRHSTRNPGAANTVTVKVNLDGPLRAKCSPKIVVDGVSALSCAAENVTASNSIAFAALNASSTPDYQHGLIALTPASDITAGAFDVSFSVTNPCGKQPGARISAYVEYDAKSAGGSVSTAGKAAFKTSREYLPVCEGSTLGKPVQTDMPSVNYSVTASNNTAGQPNDVTITFKANFRITPGMELRISGLNDLEGVPSESSTGFTAQLDASKGVLTFIATAAVNADTEATYTVSVTNKKFGSGAQTIALSVAGYS
ncbi:MAG: hypothetical protein ACPIOQ_65615, partial [Promethearchaeia archaeon]